MLSSSVRVRLLTRRVQWNHVRRLKARTGAGPAEESSDEVISRASGNCTPQLPKVPKHRDPHAVLKALSSTVSQLDHPLDMGRSKADPLAPRHRNEQVMYMMSMEAGRRAANTIIHTRPKLFPARKPVPNLLSATNAVPKNKEDAVKVSRGRHEDYLIGLLDQKKTQKALIKYKELQKKKKSVSLETQNRLLTLLSFYGVMNKIVPVPVQASGLMPNAHTTNRTKSFSFDEEEDKAVEEETLALLGNKEPMKRKLPLTEMYKVWNEENLAEMMFAEMKEKDGLTYSAMIIGLVKFKNYCKAFEMFDEARKQKFQLDLSAYNALLQALADSVVPHTWQKAKLVVAEMSKEPVVSPDLTTMNTLLGIAQFSGSSAEDLALATMREISHLGLRPNLATLVKLLVTFMRNDNASILYPIMDYIESHRDMLTLTSPSDIYFFVTAMISCKMKLRDPVLAKRLREIADTDNWYLVSDIYKFMNNYIYTLAEAGHLEECKKEYSRSVPILFKPTDWLVKTLFRMCEKQRDPDFAVYIWSEVLRWKSVVNELGIIHCLMAALISKTNPENHSNYLRAVEQAWRNIDKQFMTPNDFIISATVKMYCLDNNTEQSWFYYDLFKKYHLKPTFLALSSLLKLSARSRDTKAVEILLKKIVECNYFLPISFVRDVCTSVQIPVTTSTAIIERLQMIGQEMRVGGPAVQDTTQKRAWRRH